MTTSNADLAIRTNQGKDKFWRWSVFYGFDKTNCYSISIYKTREEAHEAARQALGIVEIEGLNAEIVELKAKIIELEGEIDTLLGAESDTPSADQDAADESIEGNLKQ